LSCAFYNSSAKSYRGPWTPWVKYNLRYFWLHRSTPDMSQLLFLFVSRYVVKVMSLHYMVYIKTLENEDWAASNVGSNWWLIFCRLFSCFYVGPITDPHVRELKQVSLWWGLLLIRSVLLKSPSKPFLVITSATCR